MNDNDKKQEGTPSPYQNADVEIAIIDVDYISPSLKKRLHLGRTIRKITKEGNVSYTLLDPDGQILGPDLPNEELAREVWAVIAETFENRAKELDELRHDKNKDQDKGIGR